MRAIALGAGLLMTAGLLVGCASGTSRAGADGHVLRVVAAENFWGSIAAQLGGSHVEVDSIVDSPTADPHDYEPTAEDARAVASADLVLVNGVGYDTWASKLAAANPDSSRVDLNVGDIVGASRGANPHRWYNPDDVRQVVTRLVQAYQRLDPQEAAYFTSQQAAFDSTATAAYRSTVADIKATYAGTPVGASESIFAMVAPALGLDLVTPPGFLRAISEGTDPTAADKATTDEQITDHRIAVYVYNSQNATPDVQAQVRAAKAAGIPVTTITETMTPATASWEDWQTRQLLGLRAALAEATGR